MIHKEKYIFSCDWGTSSFRLRLISIARSFIVAEEINHNGILQSFEQWKRKSRGKDRVSFYLDIINKSIKKIRANVSFSLDEIPLIISGMASSSAGMIELPYKNIPFSVDGSDLVVKKMQLKKQDFARDIFIVSGVKTKNDVMRGEETQVVGCTGSFKGEQTFIFPGTHSKHIYIKDNRVLDFKTYMTGELFSLLSEKSILAEGVSKTKGSIKEKYKNSFREGVRQSLDHDLLHNSFRVRTNYLFGKLSKEENYFYLAGVVIGAELRNIRPKRNSVINLVANSTLLPLYKEAFKTMNKKITSFPDADKALINGHLKIYKLLFKNK